MPTEPIPEVDPWESGGDHWDQLITIVDTYFGELLHSLWKATYAQDAFVSGQLRDFGYDLDRVGHTNLGLDPLQNLMAGLREGGGEGLTMMAAPDLVDLKPVDLAELARRGHHTKSPIVEIEDPEEFEDE